MAPREAAAMPLPSEETTPPVTQIKRVIVKHRRKEEGDLDDRDALTPKVGEGGRINESRRERILTQYVARG
jgi:hypothetical protein